MTRSLPLSMRMWHVRCRTTNELQDKLEHELTLLIRDHLHDNAEGPIWSQVDDILQGVDKRQPEMVRIMTYELMGILDDTPRDAIDPDLLKSAM